MNTVPKYTCLQNISDFSDVIQYLHELYMIYFIICPKIFQNQWKPSQLLHPLHARSNLVFHQQVLKIQLK